MGFIREHGAHPNVISGRIDCEKSERGKSEGEHCIKFLSGKGKRCGEPVHFVRGGRGGRSGATENFSIEEG